MIIVFELHKSTELFIQDLEVDIRGHQGTVNSMNAAGNEIIRQSAAPDSNKLREKLEDVNQRWKNISTEVLNRQDRFVYLKFKFEKEISEKFTVLSLSLEETLCNISGIVSDILETTCVHEDETCSFFITDSSTLFLHLIIVYNMLSGD